MGLFSPRNFIAPFTNTVNLIAIIFIVLLFAVFRFSSGRYQVQTFKDKPTVQATIPASANPSSLDKIESLLEKDGAAQTANEKTNANLNTIDLQAEIDALAKGSSSVKPSETDKSKTEPSLSDVEKALGLR